MNTFTFNGKEYEYYNGPWARAVEIPVFFERLYCAISQEKSILEIGNVMSHHYKLYWNVIDLCERAPGVQNIDATFFKPTRLYDFIFSISTFEHIGEPRYTKTTNQPFRPLAAAYNIYNNALSPGGTFMFSIPLRYRTGSDMLVWQGFPNAQIGFLEKVKPDKWVQVDAKRAREIKQFGKPFKGANGLAIVEVTK